MNFFISLVGDAYYSSVASGSCSHNAVSDGTTCVLRDLVSKLVTPGVCWSGVCYEEDYECSFDSDCYSPDEDIRCLIAYCELPPGVCHREILPNGAECYLGKGKYGKCSVWGTCEDDDTDLCDTDEDCGQNFFGDPMYNSRPTTCSPVFCEPGSPGEQASCYTDLHVYDGRGCKSSSGEDGYCLNGGCYIPVET
jgi:hypothetical protein